MQCFVIADLSITFMQVLCSVKTAAGAGVQTFDRQEKQENNIKKQISKLLRKLKGGGANSPLVPMGSGLAARNLC